MAPPKHLPSTSELRRTGATIISRRKPNSRSQTSEAAENMAVNMTAMHSTPGYTNVRRLTPWVPAEAIRESPVPRTNRNRNGCIRAVRMRRRSWLKRISSRFQTTLIARSSPRALRVGTRTPATSGSIQHSAGGGAQFG